MTKLYTLMFSLLFSSINLFAGDQQNIQLTPLVREGAAGDRVRTQNAQMVPLIAPLAQNTSSWWTRKKKIGVGLFVLVSASIACGIRIGVDGNSKPPVPPVPPKPDFVLPPAEGPKGQCYYIHFAESVPNATIHRNINPTCSLLNRSSLGFQDCPSRIDITFGIEDEYYCKYMAPYIPCYTDQQMADNMPKFCNYYWGNKTNPKSPPLKKIQRQINNTSGKKMTSADRKHRQRVMARKLR